MNPKVALQAPCTALQMHCQLSTFNLLLNYFDGELLFIEPLSSLAWPVFLYTRNKKSIHYLPKFPTKYSLLSHYSLKIYNFFIKFLHLLLLQNVHNVSCHSNVLVEALRCFIRLEVTCPIFLTEAICEALCSHFTWSGIYVQRQKYWRRKVSSAIRTGE